MTYLQDKKRKQKKAISVITILLACVVVIFGVSKTVSIIRPLGAHTTGSLYGVVSNANNVIDSRIESKQSLQKKITKLEEELETYKERESRYNVQDEEIKILREITQTKETVNSKTTVSRISPISPYGIFLVKIIQGAISVGDVIVSPTGQMAGFVENIDGDIVQVASLGTAKHKMEAKLLNSDVSFEVDAYSRGVVIGKVPRSTEIEIGDTAVTLVGTKLVPVGTVVEYSKDEKSPFKDVFIRSNVQIKNQYMFLSVPMKDK